MSIFALIAKRISESFIGQPPVECRNRGTCFRLETPCPDCVDLNAMETRSSQSRGSVPNG